MSRSCFVLALLVAAACSSHQDLGDGDAGAPPGPGNGSEAGAPIANGTVDAGPSPSGTADAAPPIANGNGDAGPSGTTVTPEDPHVVCNQLLACAATQSPSQLGSYQPEYGSTGTCWAANAAAACGASCQQAIDLLYKTGSGTACNVCQSMTDCQNHGTSAPPRADGMFCSAATNTCVNTCASDADCSVFAGSFAIGPYCIGGACRECRTSSQCGPGKPYGAICTSASTCGCATDTDCPAGKICQTWGSPAECVPGDGG